MEAGPGGNRGDELQPRAPDALRQRNEALQFIAAETAKQLAPVVDAHFSAMRRISFMLFGAMLATLIALTAFMWHSSRQISKSVAAVEKSSAAVEKSSSAVEKSAAALEKSSTAVLKTTEDIQNILGAMQETNEDIKNTLREMQQNSERERERFVDEVMKKIGEMNERGEFDKKPQPKQQPQKDAPKNGGQSSAPSSFNYKFAKARVLAAMNAGRAGFQAGGAGKPVRMARCAC